MAAGETRARRASRCASRCFRSRRAELTRDAEADVGRISRSSDEGEASGSSAADGTPASVGVFGVFGVFAAALLREAEGDWGSAASDGGLPFVGVLGVGEAGAAVAVGSSVALAAGVALAAAAAVVVGALFGVVFFEAEAEAEAELLFCRTPLLLGAADAAAADVVRIVAVSNPPVGDAEGEGRKGGLFCLQTAKVILCSPERRL